MKRECKFKVSACGKTFKVVAVDGVCEDTLWAVMNGRVYAKRPFLYSYPDDAVNRAFYLAKEVLHDNNLLMSEQ